SLFPKDCRIDVHDLIKLWISQGLTKPSSQNQCLEDVGYEYFTDLLWRSFFQEPQMDNLGCIETCKMHDLMHDLAISVAGSRYVVIDQVMENLHNKIHHVSFDFSSLLPGNEVTESSLAQKRTIRTLLSCTSGDDILDGVQISDFVLSNFKRLWTLKSSEHPKIAKLRAWEN
ncbi:hypothetical protein TorRG33x02_348110, partial [Trema orientale]